MKWRAAVMVVAALVAGCEAPRVERSPAESGLARPVIAPRLGSGPAEVVVVEERVKAPARTRDLEAELAAARAAYEANPSDEEAIIWLARRLGYVGRFEEAIEVLTRGLKIHPDSHRILRHRGHRYITTRRFDEAVADLSLAARLAGEPPRMPRYREAEAGHVPGADEVEAEGAPNRLQTPRSTTRFNIYYHLALAHFLRSGAGDVEASAEAWGRCMRFAARNDDMTVATANWLYLALMRLGREGEARRVLEPIHAGMNTLEDGDYLTLCLYHKGELEREAVLARATPAGSTRAETLMFGVGMNLLARGERERAAELFRRVVEEAGSARASFGYIAAERMLELMDE